MQDGQFGEQDKHEGGKVEGEQEVVVLCIVCRDEEPAMSAKRQHKRQGVWDDLIGVCRHTRLGTDSNDVSREDGLPFYSTTV